MQCIIGESMALSSTELHRRYRARHPERVREADRKYRERHSEECQKKYRRNGRLRNARIRLEVLSHYSGGSLHCALCGYDDARALEIDHINGGGTQERKTLKLRGVHFYDWLKKQGYPEGYRVLCCNCNRIASLEALDSSCKESIKELMK